MKNRGMNNSVNHSAVSGNAVSFKYCGASGALGVLDKNAHSQVLTADILYEM